MFDFQTFIKDKRLRQVELAAILEVTPGTLSNVKNGRRAVPYEWLNKLEKKYGKEEIAKYMKQEGEVEDPPVEYGKDATIERLNEKIAFYEKHIEHLTQIITNLSKEEPPK